VIVVVRYVVAVVAHVICSSAVVAVFVIYDGVCGYYACYYSIIDGVSVAVVACCVDWFVGVAVVFGVLALLLLRLFGYRVVEVRAVICVVVACDVVVVVIVVVVGVGAIVVVVIFCCCCCCCFFLFGAVVGVVASVIAVTVKYVVGVVVLYHNKCWLIHVVYIYIYNHTLWHVGTLLWREVQCVFYVDQRLNLFDNVMPLEIPGCNVRYVIIECVNSYGITHICSWVCSGFGRETTCSSSQQFNLIFPLFLLHTSNTLMAYTLTSRHVIAVILYYFSNITYIQV